MSTAPATNQGGEVRNILAFEETLKEGMKVQARWTCCYSYYRAQAEIVRVNRASVRVRLTEEIRNSTGSLYPIGREITVPRFMGNKWSRSYCVTEWSAS